MKATGSAHDEFRCAALAAMLASGMSLSQHGADLTPVTVSMALLKALAILSARGNVRFVTNN